MIVNFNDGNVNNDNKTNSQYVRSRPSTPSLQPSVCLQKIFDFMDTIFTMAKLYQAYQACLSGKKNTVNALEFEIDREKNLSALLFDLKSRKYKISRHICFIVTSPTPREIFAAHFRDRIVHHLLLNEIQAFFEADFIPHTYANRVGKGTHKAVAQLQKNMRQTKRRYPEGVYYLKLDIESFFRSIDRATLFSLVRHQIMQKSGGGRLVASDRPG